MNNDILTAGQVAKLCGVVPSTVQYWEKKGYISSLKTFGGHRRFKKDIVLEFMKRRDSVVSSAQINKIIKPDYKIEKRGESRIVVEFPVSVALVNGNPDNKLVFKGKVSNLSKNGCGVYLSGLDFNSATIKAIIKKYNKILMEPKEKIGFIKKEIKGRIVNFSLGQDKLRVGICFN